jgi:hypothetical protein
VTAVLGIVAQQIGWNFVFYTLAFITFIPLFGLFQVKEPSQTQLKASFTSIQSMLNITFLTGQISTETLQSTAENRSDSTVSIQHTVWHDYLWLCRHHLSQSRGEF